VTSSGNILKPIFAMMRLRGIDPQSGDLGEPA
jgi:hypothetical protein